MFPPPPGANRRALARYDPFGGMQSHSGQLSAALDDLGMAQTVVTAWRPGAARRTPLGRHGRVLRFGVPLRRGRQLYAVAALPSVRRLARGCDVVHVHLGEDLAVIPLGMAAARAAGAPMVLTVHCSLRHTFHGRGLRPALLRTVGAALERLGERRATQVIALSARTADAVVASGVPHGRVRVIPSGVDARRFTVHADDPLPDVRGPRVLYVGRLASQKDPLTAVEAFARMTAEATLVVVGDGPLRAAVEAAADRTGVAGRTRLMGFVPHEEVAPFLQHADVLILPSAYEEQGSVLVEAMAAGLPAVASAVGGIPSVVAHGVTGLLVEPGDADGFAVALDRIVGDPELRGRLAAGARQAACRYDWAALAHEVTACYRAALVRR